MLYALRSVNILSRRIVSLYNNSTARPVFFWLAGRTPRGSVPERLIGEYRAGRLMLGSICPGKLYKSTATLALAPAPVGSNPTAAP